MKPDKLAKDAPSDAQIQAGRDASENAVLILGVIVVMVVAIVVMLITGTAFGLTLRRLQTRRAPNKNAG